jgi:simple sugar transport system substrate-binding protein
VFKALIIGFLSLVFSSVVFAEDDSPLKVAFVYVGPTGDAGWTHSHDKARLYMEEKLGEKIETTYVESVAEGADAERIIRQLARAGNKLIFTTSFGYMNPTIKVAKKFPDVKFEHASGYTRRENVGTYFDRAYQGRYLTGMVAGLMTKSHLLGYVASFPIPEVIRGINAFTLGARAVNPKAEVKVTWVSSWYDPGKESAAANTMINMGADVITQHTDSPGPINAAEKKGVFAIGYHTDMSVYGEKAHLTAIEHNWGPLYVAKAKSVLDGTWKSEDVWGGLGENALGLAPYSDRVPKIAQAVVDHSKSLIAKGKLHPFAGPIKDQSGKLRVLAGKSMSDADMLGMDWYVQGVQAEKGKKETEEGKED